MKSRDASTLRDPQAATAAVTSWSAGLHRQVCFLMLAGLFVRVLLVLFYTPRSNWTSEGDPSHYLAWGRSLARTGTYLQTPIDDKMPGMAALVAVGCRFGESGCKYFPLILFAACGTAAATGLWWLLLPALRPRARGWSLAALQFGVLELQVFVHRLLPDLPAVTLGIGAVCALVAARRRHSYLFGAVAGLALGTALYVRPDYGVVAAALAVVWVLVACKEVGTWRACGTAGVLVGTIALLILPWGLRNQRLTGEFRVFSDHGERTLWWAFNDGRHLDWVPGGEPWKSAPLSERAAIARSEAWRWVEDHPAYAGFLVVSRVLSHVSLTPTAAVWEAANPIRHRWRRWPYRVTAVLIREFCIIAGLTALVLAGARLPLSLVLLGTFAVVRLVFPGALIPDRGRYAIVFLPFLTCCAIWLTGGLDQPPFSQRVKVGLRVAALVIAIQALFLARWGWSFWAS